MSFRRFNGFIAEKLANEIDEAALRGVKKGALYGALGGAGLGALLAARNPLLLPATAALGGLLGGDIAGAIGAIRAARKSNDIGERPTFRGVLQQSLEPVRLSVASLGGLLAGIQNKHPIIGTLLGVPAAYGARSADDGKSRLIKSMIEKGIAGSIIGGGAALATGNPLLAPVGAAAGGLIGGIVGNPTTYLLGKWLSNRTRKNK